VKLGAYKTIEADRAHESVKLLAKSVMNPDEKKHKGPTPIVAVDCEMVDCSGEKRLAR
jgi:hypothetical protein